MSLKNGNAVSYKLVKSTLFNLSFGKDKSIFHQLKYKCVLSVKEVFPKRSDRIFVNLEFLVKIVCQICTFFFFFSFVCKILWLCNLLFYEIYKIVLREGPLGNLFFPCQWLRILKNINNKLKQSKIHVFFRFCPASNFSNLLKVLSQKPKVHLVEY